MSILGIDLGGTKLASAVFTRNGSFLSRETVPLEGRSGKAVGKLVTDTISTLINKSEKKGGNISSIGISVPGISSTGKGTVWAPNIRGWERISPDGRGKRDCR